MKTILLILMVLASVAMAGEPGTPTARMSDAEMTALIVGIWEDYCTFGTIEYKSDGTLVFNFEGKDYIAKWSVKDGEFLETDSETGWTNYFKILFLTEDEFLRLGVSKHNKGYRFLKHVGY